VTASLRTCRALARMCPWSFPIPNTRGTENRSAIIYQSQTALRVLSAEREPPAVLMMQTARPSVLLRGAAKTLPRVIELARSLLLAPPQEQHNGQGDMRHDAPWWTHPSRRPRGAQAGT
jgi:hypothetical protein